jgi:acyl-CoA synthetase (NDP forming)
MKNFWSKRNFSSKNDFRKMFYFGIKKTPEFGHVLIFGDGGTDVEKKKDVSIRAVPIKKEDA